MSQLEEKFRWGHGQITPKLLDICTGSEGAQLVISFALTVLLLPNISADLEVLETLGS